MRRWPLEKALTPPTRFTNPHAVDLWDSRFRWRSGNRLCDRTIDATWQRVAAALADREGEECAYWRSRYAFAFGQWQLLPDPRLLRFAGTDMPVPPLREPIAAVNAGAFVLDPHTRRARFDHQRFGAAAAVAVRMLDDAALAFGSDDDRPMRFGIGIVGLGDALDALGLACDRAQAPRAAQEIARGLALGCLHGSLKMLEERGDRHGLGDGGLAELWRQRALPAELADAVARNHRHERLTRIDGLSELALLANGASDSFDVPERGPNDSIEAGSVNMQTLRRAILRAVHPWIDAQPQTSPLEA